MNTPVTSKWIHYAAGRHQFLKIGEKTGKGKITLIELLFYLKEYALLCFLTAQSENSLLDTVILSPAECWDKIQTPVTI